MKAWCLAALSACAFGFGSAASADAGGLLYDCDITQRDARVDWISQKYVFVVQDRGVTVVDTVLLHFDKEPRLTHPRATGSKLRITWSVATTDSLNTQVRMSYRAVLDTKTKNVTVRVTPVGYPQGWSGKGTCKTRTP